MFDKFYEEVGKGLFSDDVKARLTKVGDELAEIKRRNGTIFFFGNGASSAIASHCAIDFMKQGGVKTDVCHDVAVLTAFGNDLGFHEVFAKYIQLKVTAADACVFFSVSGNSENIKRGVDAANAAGALSVGLSGMTANNYLNTHAELPLHVSSRAYNVCEGIHMLWITSVCDYLVGDIFYDVS